MHFDHVNIQSSIDSNNDDIVDTDDELTEHDEKNESASSKLDGDKDKDQNNKTKEDLQIDLTQANDDSDSESSECNDSNQSDNDTNNVSIANEIIYLKSLYLINLLSSLHLPFIKDRLQLESDHNISNSDDASENQFDIEKHSIFNQVSVLPKKIY